ncbi:hypothetical protein Chor_004178 [Crotalus horridus]
MATRRLTDAYLLLRNNAIQSRQLLAEQVSSYSSSSPLTSRSMAAAIKNMIRNILKGKIQYAAIPKVECQIHLKTDTALKDYDRMALVSGISLDPEAAVCVTKRLPPKWIDGIEEIQYEISRIKQKMKELASLHDKHLNRPTLDDSSEEEHAIEITTQEITQLFHRCQRAVQGLHNKSRSCTDQECRLLKNVVYSLAQSLQDLSTSFRHGQSDYLKRLGFTDDQLVLVEQNTILVEEREREIRQVIQSITDLNEIFRDLGAMVVEQGTVLDRIDYNVEQSCIKTEEGLKQLHKVSRECVSDTEQYQKKNRKMLIILILFVIVIVLIIVLIAVKFR